MQETLISIKNLGKRYKQINAIEGITFSVKRGDVFGIIGPNGSGKTTTLKIILSVTSPDSGTVEFADGISGKNIGAYLDSAGFNPLLTVWDNLKLTAIIKNVTSDDILNQALQKAGLPEKKNEKYKNLSLGLKQRLSIATTFIGDPGIVVLDEPTNGLDPNGLMEVRELIRTLNGEGKTILLASHILTEMEKICNKIAVYNAGKLMKVDTTENLVSEFGSLENAFINLAK